MASTPYFASCRSFEPPIGLDRGLGEFQTRLSKRWRLATGKASRRGKARTTKGPTPCSGGQRPVREDYAMPIVTLKVNGRSASVDVQPPTLLGQLLPDTLLLTGTHVGCDTSQCGACVVHVDGRAVKSCTVFALQAEGADVTTIEGLANGGGLHPMQAAFRENHGLQCGFCTPGMIMAAIDIVRRKGNKLDEDTIRDELSGNLCRCTGYHNIVKAIAAGAKAMSSKAGAPKAACGGG